MQPTFDYEVDLKLKNILIIMPKFYAYQTKMHDDLIARGANVAFYDEEPEKTKFLILKNLERIFKKKNIFKRFNEQLKEKIIAEPVWGCIRSSDFPVDGDRLSKGNRGTGKNRGSTHRIGQVQRRPIRSRAI